MSYEDKKKRLQELKDQVRGKTNNSSSSSASNYSNSKAQKLESLKQQVRGKQASSVSDRINTWFDNYNNFVNNYNSRYSTRKGTYEDSYVSDSGDWLDTISAQKSNFDKEASAIMSYLDQYGDYFGKEYTDSVKNAFQSALGQQSEILKQASSDKDYWSQFADENEYLGYQSEYKKQKRYEGYAEKYAGMSYEDILAATNKLMGDEEKDWLKNEAVLRYDLNAAQEEIGRLTSILDVKDQISKIKQEESTLKLAVAKGDKNAAEKLAKNNQRLEALNSTWDHALSTYGSEDDLNSLLSSKSMEYTIASRAQKAAELASVVDNDPQFSNYSELGKNISYENVGSTKKQNGATIYDDLKAATLALNEHQLGTELYNESMRTPGEGLSGYFKGLKGLSEYNTENSETVEIFRKMNEREFATLAYYLKKDEENGTDLAAQYIDSIRQTLNTRVASDIAEAKEGKLMQQYAFAVGAGIDQFFEGRDAFFSGEDNIIPSATQIASGIIREDLAETGKKVEWLGGVSLGQLGYDALNTTANMLPSMLAGAVTNIALPGAGTAIGAGFLGMSAGGNAKAEMLRLGYSKEQATSYGLMVGIAEAGMEYLLGHIPGLSKGDGLFSTLGTKVASKVDNAISRVAITLGDKGTDILRKAAGRAIGAVGGALDEALEEGLQTIIEPWLKEMATSVDWDAPNVDEVLYSSLLGAITSLGMGGAKNAIQDVTTSFVQNAEAKKNYGVAQRELAAKAVEIDPSNKFAQRMQAKVDNGKNLTGAQLNRLVKQNNNTLTAQEGNTDTINAEAYGRIAAELDTEDSSATVSEPEKVQQVTGKLPASKADSRPDTKVGDKVAQTGEVEASEGDHIREVTKKVGETPATLKEGGKDVGVKVKEISSVKDGKITVKLDSGEVVDASEVDFGNEDTALVYQAAAEMSQRAGYNEDTVKVLVNGFESSGLNAAEYLHAFRDSFNYGAAGTVSVSALEKGKYTSLLPQKQRELAFHLGKAFGEESAQRAEQERARIENEKTASAEKEAKAVKASGEVIFDGSVNQGSLSKAQKAQIKVLQGVSSAVGAKIRLFASEATVTEDGRRTRVFSSAEGEAITANGWYDNETGEIWIDVNAGVDGNGLILFTAAHELTHFIKDWSSDKYNAFANFLISQYAENGVSVDELIEAQIEKAARHGREMTREEAFDEVVADSCESFLTDSNAAEKISALNEKDATLAEKIKSYIHKLLLKIRNLLKGIDPDSEEGRIVRGMTDSLEQLYELWTDALEDAGRSYQAAGVALDSNTESVAPQYSERTWTASEYVAEREVAAKKLAEALGVTVAEAETYIDNVNSIAKTIANDRVRLDYEASSFGSAFVSNVEYGGSFDYTTLCKKRRIYTGTFQEIQKRIGDEVLSPDDILEIRNMMIEGGIEATCGLCYVEGSRANMGKFSKEFIRLYKRDNPDGWIPTMVDVNTPDGVEQMRISHPEVYESYEYFWNHYGKLNDSDPALFASQQKPKLYEARKEYKGEILQHFKDVGSIAKKNRNGGIRMQSFSDFEIVHLIDTMQVIMDMSQVGLAGQAYTKVPEFAEAFGNTGLKINLSLIAKGVDADGNLIFDDREGMPHETAFRIRDKYSENVGTILVAFTDEQLKAAMADPLVDFIIPFHRSQWKKSQYGAMGLPKGTKDYTFMQNEKLIKPTYHEYRGKMVKDKASNYMPNEYWDFSKSGKENAEAYLEMCAENNKRPKFYKLLDFDGKGKYSLKKDGSTDGYWKLLIDFKMYDNDGVGVPQRAVTPDFSMDEAMTMLDEYKGGHQSYPIARGVVDKFVEGYKEKSKVKYSEREIIGASGNNYGIGVYLDSELLSNLTDEERVEMIKEYVKELGGKAFTAYDNNNNAVEVHISEANKKFKNKSGKRVPVNRDLSQKHIKNKVKQETITLVDELVSTSTYDTKKKPLYSHGWLDNHGKNDWEYWVTYVQDKENTIWRATLNIATTANGEKILYDINPIKKVEQSVTSDTSTTLMEERSVKSDTISTNNIISHPDDSVNSKSKNFSERDLDAVSNREVLANALEGAVQNDIEAERLAEYKSKIEEFDAEEQKLRQLRAEIKKLSFTPGKRDNARLAELRAEAEKTANRINIYDKQLLRLEASKPLEGILQREKQKAYKKAKADAAEKMNDMRAVVVREKIKKIKAEIERELQRPTDRTYIPTPLGRAMIEVCSLIDTDTPLIKKNGTVNRAQEKREKTKERLSELAAEYENLKNNDDYMLVKEHDEQIDAYLKQLRNEFDDVSIKDMSLDQLREFHDILRSIIGTLRDARKVIGKNDAKGLYEYGNAIISEQKKIGEKRGERSNFQKQRDKRLNLSLSPMRNIERMSGYNPDSALVEITRDFEEGVRKKNFWEMGARKSFDSLITGKNEKNYQDSIYKEFGKEYTDSKGRKFRVSKMQMMQAILSYEREISNAGKKHIEKGGLTFADLKLLEQGKIADAVSGENAHNVPNAAYLVVDFISALANDKWAQDYMATAREFFNKTAKDAINDTYLRLKHRIIARDKNYIPYEVDKTQVVRDITNMDSLQQTINSYGILQDTQKNAPQALIITGLNNMVDRHIDQVGSVYGLAIPVRNFNKIWNIRESAIDGGEGKPITVVQGVIEENWGADGKKFIEQMVTDLQGARKNTRSELERKIESGYIGATFALNLSVVMKQIGSLYTANSELDRSRTGVGMLTNLAYTMAHFDKLAAEVDKYTAAVYNRRQGLSDNEVHTFITQAKKSGISRALDKLPAGINPTKWITFMDASVALSLWKYVKADVAKSTKLKGEELLKETAKRFDSLIENTQSMSDVLHKPEVQKRQDAFSKSFAMFKTDLYQSAGQLRVMAGRYQANKSDANKKALTRTVVSIARSAAWNSLMTTLFALLRYKVNPYRDDEEELTPESWLKRQGVMLAGDFAGYLFPIFGSEIVGLIENVIYGESEEAVDSLALTLVNDLVDSITTIGNAITEGEMPDASEWENLLMKSAQFLGIPLSNIKRTVKAIRLHAEDIANGEFLSFEAGANKTDAKQLYDAVISGNDKRIEKAEALFDDQKAIDSALRKGLRENDVRIKAAARMLNSGDIRGFAGSIETISGEGVFDGETVEAAIRAEASAFNSKIKAAAEAKRDGETDDYIKIVKELRESYRGVYTQDEIVEAVNSYTFEDVVEDDVEEFESVYKNSDINAALESGDTDTASEIIKELIEVKAENNFLKAQREAEESGKRFKEKEARTRAELDARSTIRSSLTNYWKKRYIAAYESGNEAEINRISELLYSTGIYGNRKKYLDEVLEGWLEK